MPRENKKRGRRAENKKRKLEEESELQQEEFSTQEVQEYVPAVKRHKPDREKKNAPEKHKYDPEKHNAPIKDDMGQDFMRVDLTGDALEESGVPADLGAMPFYGLLDESEQAYFKSADEQLEANTFADPEERAVFLTNVFREAKGKEIKIASSQGVSRLLERMILLSSSDQLKALFRAFSGNFSHLVRHRFASHCCEALFIHAATVVTQELHVPVGDAKSTEVEIDMDPSGDKFVSMGTYFLNTAAELRPHVGFFMSHRFASHALRVLLLVLSGSPLSDASPSVNPSTSRSLIRSKKKENNVVYGLENQKNDELLAPREVSKEFKKAMEELMYGMVEQLDTNALRALATHPVANPTLQLLLKIELTNFGKNVAKDSASIIYRLLPDDPMTPESGSGQFINGLMYETVGARLLETIITHAPSKAFKAISRDLFQGKLATLARNEVAMYVVSRVLERFGKNDLEEARNEIVPAMGDLFRRNRYQVVGTLIERCYAREVDTGPIASELQSIYHAENDSFDIAQFLHLSDLPSDPTSTDAANPTNFGPPPDTPKPHPHVSKLSQTITSHPSPLSTLLLTSLSTLPPPSTLSLAYSPYFSPLLVSALTVPHASVVTRRKLIATFYGHLAPMALDPSASRVVDAIWTGTAGLAFMRDRVAEELVEAEEQFRGHRIGRWVWKNWKMELYKRDRREWTRRMKEEVEAVGFVGWPDGGERKSGAEVGKEEQQWPQRAPGASGHGQRDAKFAKGPAGAQAGQGKPKSAMDRARERHVAEKARREKAMARHYSSANAQGVASRGKGKETGAEAGA
ncbi:ARM repeat-containing protein [Eremomyces bilateralis CBS 781.70]|uniref:Nucleolar protein 9 n=1 Tax=Eremomyces bilateralis CBS 781.70 TaxID=1392243 RepID=A0A6G1FXR5_9PEZI|nr:ARM repeat-containing protein [Eremomyces bilateralis CBS 781.70]KAF1810627.1 ARM repeat-containing protein [Eremomyces bilateralis CBS 781.70]